MTSLEIMKKIANIDILIPYVVTKWVTQSTGGGALRLTGAMIQETTTMEQKLIECDGVFLMIGATPNTAWLEETLQLDENGHIELENDLRELMTTTHTSMNGVFAAGEVIDSTYRQAITAAAAGAQAALDAERWLRQKMDPKNKNSMKIAKDPVMMINRVEFTKEESCDLTQTDCIQKIVEAHPIVVFSKPWCPYCQRALEALAIEGAKSFVIDLSKHENTQDIQNTLLQMTGRRTVPNVFVGASSIGGGDETVALQHSGELKALLEQAGAIETLKHKQYDENLIGP